MKPGPSKPIPLIDRAEILATRPSRNVVDPSRPYAFFLELEHSARGVVEDVATLFLVNSECPFTCVFCDLWKNTLTESTPPGATPAQIAFALDELRTQHSDRAAKHIKLYNSGNFFDRRAVPLADYGAIADLVRGFETVIVENHPKLCGEDCLRFRDLIAPAQLEVAMGLETIHPDVLPRLNKSMTLDDFRAAAAFLRTERIAMRSFILLGPPYLQEEEAIEWTLRSMAFAFDQGVGCCSIIPARGGNGMMEKLAKAGAFQPPRLRSLEVVAETAIVWNRGRVFADVWEARQFAQCEACVEARIDRLTTMNLTQRLISPIDCPLCSGGDR